MGRSKDFKILFDNDKETYFAGEQLAGTVLLEFSEPTNIVRLILIVKGKAICKVGNSCTELVYKNDATLYGTLAGSASVNRQHPAGKQNYRFNFNLPAELPSSTYEGGGMIKYTLTAKVVFKGLLTSDWQVKKDFKVKQMLDANIPNYESEHVHTVRKTSTIFTNQKKLEREDILMSLQRGVYCAGEEIKLNLQYKYVEARKMGLVKCRLNKYKQLNKRENKSVYKKTVKELNDSKRNEDKIYQRLITIPIPNELSPTNTLTNAVVISYVLHVKVEGYKEWKLPLTIGTIPFDETRHERVQQHIQSTGAGTMTEEPLPRIPSSVPSAPSAPDDLHPSQDTGGEIQCEFFHPPPYVPANEFESPPSYDEVLQETQQISPGMSNTSLVAAQ